MGSKVQDPFEFAGKMAKDKKRSRGAIEEKRRRQSSAAYDSLVAAQTAAGAAPAPIESTMPITQMRQSGAVLRVPAGGAARLTLTGLAGWTFSDTHLAIQPYGENVALPLNLPHNTPGPTIDQKTYAAARSLPLSPPLFVKSLIYRYRAKPVRKNGLYELHGIGDLLQVTSDGVDKTYKIASAHPDDSQPSQSVFIGGTVSELTVLQASDHTTPFLITAILPNIGDGLSVAAADDRVLHQVPRKLSFGDAATTSDLSETLNSGEDSVELLIKARSGCALNLSLTTRRAKTSSGTQDTLADPLIITPWAPVVLRPTPPAAGSFSTTLSGIARVNGPARAGLLEIATRADCQRIQLPPRVSLAQPFSLSNTGNLGRRFSGLWLMLSDAPTHDVTLVAKITRFDPETGPGETLAKAMVTVPKRQMDLIPVQDGIFAFWAKLETELVIDTPQLADTLAVLISDVSGPVSLLEAPRTNSALMPALWRDFSRSDRWQTRRFGASDKALMFELGETGDHPARLNVTSDQVTILSNVQIDGDNVSWTLPNSGNIRIFSDREIELKGFSVMSSTEPT